MFIIVCSYAPTETIEDVNKSAEMLKKAAAKLSENGFCFHYHNHAHEFKKYDGEFANDIMSRIAGGINAEVDTFWVWFAGVNPCDYLESRRSEISLVHIKDGTKEYKTAVGEGNVDIQSILDKSAEIGAEWLIIEDESEPGGLESVAVGINNLKDKYTVK